MVTPLIFPIFEQIHHQKVQSSANNYNYKMQINFNRFEECLSRRDKKDLYCRPLTALFFNHTHTRTYSHNETAPNLAHRKENQGYTTRLLPSQKKTYRNIRSASLYESAHPQQKQFKIHIINNNCLKKVFLNGDRSFKKDHTIHLNDLLSQKIGNEIKPEFTKAKYQCKKLRVIKGKAKINFKTECQDTGDDETASKTINVSVVGTRIL